MWELHFVLDMIACPSVVRLKKLNMVDFSSYHISYCSRDTEHAYLHRFLPSQKKVHRHRCVIRATVDRIYCY